MNATRNETAAEAYARNTADVQNMIEHISDLVASHAEESKGCENWCKVGTMASMRENLMNILMNLTCGNTDDARQRELIEETLADLRVA